jgi:hypothetical protein
LGIFIHMNLQENINRIKQVMGLNELELELTQELEKTSTYEPTLNILSKNEFNYTHGYYGGKTGVKYIVGETNPIGEFRIPNVGDPHPGFDLYNDNPRDWFRCIGMLGPILKDYIQGHKPWIIVFAPDGELQRKRYQSKELIDYILGYIGHEYTCKVDGMQTQFYKK